MRILAVDVGNTMIDLGLFEDDRLVGFRTVSTHSVNECKDFKKVLTFFSSDLAIVASVVPQFTPFVLEMLEVNEKYLFDHRFPMSLKLSYKNPEELGPDRIANSLYVFHNFKKNSIILDFGTAITVDVVTREGIHLGGAILPGVDLSLNSLYRSTARIKETTLDIPSSFLGKSTKECLEVGIMRGIEGTVRHIIKNIKRELGWRRALIVATGGSFFKIRELFPDFIFEPYITLKGLVTALFLTVKKESQYD